jgi:hypothetical protein
MIQLQYYNKGLTKNQIEQILNNYNLKYTTLTKEINSKLNSLIKTVLNDISPFLENIEEISKKIKNLKEMDSHKRKIELLENKLQEKSQVEHQLQNDIISLKKEISLLKEKNKNDSTENLIKDNDNYTSPVKRNKKKSIDMNNMNDLIDLQNLKQDLKGSTRKNNIKKNDESSNGANIHSKSTMSSKKGSWKNSKEKKSNNYLMNFQEITRSLNNKNLNQNKIQNQNLNKSVKSDRLSKFISSSNKKNTKDYKDKKKPIKNKNRSIDLSNVIDTETKKDKIKNNINKNNNIIEKKEINQNDKIIEENNNKNNNEEEFIKEESYLEIIEEEIDDEIKELETDEEEILMLIDDIRNFGKKIEVV